MMWRPRSEDKAIVAGTNVFSEGTGSRDILLVATLGLTFKENCFGPGAKSISPFSGSETNGVSFSVISFWGIIGGKVSSEGLKFSGEPKTEEPQPKN